MALTTSIVTQGQLTGGSTVDTLRTADAAEFLITTFYNTHTGNVVLTLYVNGGAATNVVHEVTMPTLYSFVWRQKLGSGNSIRAEADTASVVNYTVEQDKLS